MGPGLIILLELRSGWAEDLSCEHLQRIIRGLAPEDRHFEELLSACFGPKNTSEHIGLGIEAAGGASSRPSKQSSRISSARVP